MEGNDLLYYASIGAVSLILWAPVAYLSFLGFLQTVFPGKRLRSQKEIEETVTEEAEKLGIDPNTIDIRFPGDIRDHNAIRIYTNGKAELFLKGPTTRESIIRHGLYHFRRAIDGHVKRDFESMSSALGLDYLLKEEPRAVLYGAFGGKKL